MCTLFEEIAEEGRIEGRIEGRKEGRLEGQMEGRAMEIIETGIELELRKLDILERLQKKLEISLQKAEEYFKMFDRRAG